MILVIFGSSGLLGSALLYMARQRGDIIVLCPRHEEVDIADEFSVRTFIKAARPDAIINCAAHMPADSCETDPHAAYLVNAAGAWNIAIVAEEVSAKCMYISTDFVFDGIAGAPYGVADMPQPLQVYGKSKAEGEAHTRNICGQGLVVRTASLYGPARGRSRENFIDRMLRRLRAGEEISVVDDVVMSPTYTDDAAAMILALLEEPNGIYHAVNRGQASWYELCVEAAQLSGLDVLNIRPTSLDSMEPVAPRPRYTVLSAAELPPRVQMLNRPWREALHSYISICSGYRGA